MDLNLRGEIIMDVIKISETSIQVTRKAEVPADKVTTYEYTFLVEQLARIKADVARYVKERKVEITEVEELLAHCKRLGVTEETLMDVNPNGNPV